MQSVIHLKSKTYEMFQPVFAVQNDTGRTLKMIVDDVTYTNSDTGKLYFMRSDGSYYNVSTTFSSGDNSFTADITQALTQSGRTDCQLKVTDSGDEVVSTFTFSILVQGSTDGVPAEQLGYSVEQLAQDAADIRMGGMPADLRAALLQLAQKVAYIDDQGATYYQDLLDALTPSVALVSISAVYTQSGTVYDTDSLDSLKSDLVVTALWSDTTTTTLSANEYTLSGSLTSGTSTITVTYEDKTDTFNVTVTAVLYDLQNQTLTRGASFSTNINVLQADFPFTILLDITTTENPTSGTASVAKYIFEYSATLGGRGLTIGKSTAGVSSLSLWWESNTAQTITGSTVGAARRRFAITHEANSNTVNLKYKEGSGTLITTSASNTFVVETGGGLLAFGAPGEANHCLPAGQLTLARVYGDVISSDLVDSFFA